MQNLESDEDIINTSLNEEESKPKISINPKNQILSQHKRDPLLISGQSQSISDSTIQNSLQNVTEANEVCRCMPVCNALLYAGCFQFH